MGKPTEVAGNSQGPSHSVNSLTKETEGRHIVPQLQGTVTLLETGGAPVRGHRAALGSLVAAAQAEGGSLSVNVGSGLHKVTFAFETKGKEPFIAHFRIQTKQLRNRGREGGEDIQIVSSA